MESSSSSLFSRTIGPWGEEGGAKKRRRVALKSARKALTNFFHLLHSFYPLSSSSFLRTSSISIDIGAKEEEEGEEPFFW